MTGTRKHKVPQRNSKPLKRPRDLSSRRKGKSKDVVQPKNKFRTFGKPKLKRGRRKKTKTLPLGRPERCKKPRFLRCEKQGYEAEVQVVDMSDGASIEPIIVVENEARNVAYCEELQSPAVIKELKSSDPSEMSLLSDVTAESIVDISHSERMKSRSKSSLHALSGCLSSRSAFPEIASMVTTMHTSNAIMSPLYEDSVPCSPTDDMNPVTVEADEATEEGYTSLLDLSNSKPMFHAECRCCSRSSEIPTFKEVCSFEPPSSGMVPFFTALHPTSGHNGISFSKRYLKTAGLTNINLEKLADTSSALLSVHDDAVDAQKRNYLEWVRSRQRDFLKVMKVGHCKVNNNKERNFSANNDVSKRILMSIDTDLIMKEVELITDILYCKVKCPSLIQRLLLFNHWQNKSSCCTGKMEQSMEKPGKESPIEKMAQEMEINPALNALKQADFVYNNPPVEEISRSVFSFHGKKVSSAQQDNVIERSQRSVHLQKKTKYTETECTKNMASKEIEAVTKSLCHVEDNICKTPIAPQEQNGIDREDRACLSQWSEGEMSDWSNDGTKKWLNISEWWLSEKLDINGMLELLDEVEFNESQS